MFPLPYNMNLLIFIRCLLLVSTINASANNNLDCSNKNNILYIQWVNKAKELEKDKTANNTFHAMQIYQYLINTNHGDKSLIARIRLARLIIQYKPLPNRYISALKQLAIVEKNQKSSFLIFSHYILAIIYAHGYGVPVDKNKAFSYYKKYTILLDKKIKISSLLEDISLTSPSRLKEIIGKKPKTILSWRNKENIPNYWKNKNFCKREQYNSLCHHPAWSTKQCNKVFFNDVYNENSCKTLACNNSTILCYSLKSANKERIPLHKRAYKNSTITGYLEHNAHFIQSSKKLNFPSYSSQKKPSWIYVKWCKDGPILFLHECKSNIQMGFINTLFLKQVTKKVSIKWVRKN